jgi:hypothetical protein
VLLMQPSPGGCCGAAGFMRTRSVPCIVTPGRQISGC